MIKFDIKALFKRKEFIGRGIKHLFLVSSCISENDKKIFKSSLNEPGERDYEQIKRLEKNTTPQNTGMG
jgi:hypothetical protein